MHVRHRGYANSRVRQLIANQFVEFLADALGNAFMTVWVQSGIAPICLRSISGYREHGHGWRPLHVPQYRAINASADTASTTRSSRFAILFDNAGAQVEKAGMRFLGGDHALDYTPGNHDLDARAL
jgi:hypothetical protein